MVERTVSWRIDGARLHEHDKRDKELDRYNMNRSAVLTFSVLTNTHVAKQGERLVRP